MPQTYQEAKDIAEFFTRPDQGLYGWGQMGGRDYDFATTASNSLPVVVRRRALQSRDLRGEGLPQLAGLGRRRPGLCRHVQVRPSRLAATGASTRSTPPSSRASVAMAMQWYYFNGSNADPKVNKFADNDGFGDPAGRRRPRRQVPPPVLRRRPGHGHQQLLQEDARADQVHGVVLPARAAEALRRGLPDRPQVRPRQPGLAGPELLQQAVRRARWPYPTTTGTCRNMRCCSTSCRRRSRTPISGKKTVQQALSDAAERNEQTLERAGYEIKRGETTPEVPDQVIAPVGKDAVDRSPVRLTRARERPGSGASATACPGSVPELLDRTRRSRT